jgi:hypothetical protein
MLYINYLKFWLLTLLFTTALISTALLADSGFLASIHTEMEQAHSANSFVNSIGINVHLRYLDTAYGNYNEIIRPRLKELGIRHIRDGGKDSAFFEKLNDLATMGIRSTLVMSPSDGIQPADVATIVQDISQSIEAIEGPNETDIPRFKFFYNQKMFPEGTRDYQSALYRESKADPSTASLPVLMPSLGQGRNATKLGLIQFGDLGNMHSYPSNGATPTTALDTWYIPYARVVCGLDKPIVATETGYHNAISNPSSKSAISEQASNKYLSRLLLEYFNRGIQRTFLYELIDSNPGLDQEQNFGLLRYNGSPKPVFKTIKNLISLLQDPGSDFPLQSLHYSLSGQTARIHHTLLQKRDGRFYLLLWQEVESWDSANRKDLAVTEKTVTVTLETAISEAAIYQPLQSTSPVSQYLKPQQLSLNVPDYPVLIELIPL